MSDLDRDTLHRFDIDSETADWIEKRVSIFLGDQAMTITKSSLIRLLACAYSQGCCDTVQALDQGGQLKRRPNGR